MKKGRYMQNVYPFSKFRRFMLEKLPLVYIHQAGDLGRHRAIFVCSRLGRFMSCPRGETCVSTFHHQSTGIGDGSYSMNVHGITTWCRLELYQIDVLQIQQDIEGWQLKTAISFRGYKTSLGPLLLTWINLNLSMFVVANSNFDALAQAIDIQI